jgi:RNA polymerase sigma factor (sigma-70 family)
MGGLSSLETQELASLVPGCRQGDRRAQTQFYNFCRKRLFGICLRYAGSRSEADCIFQDAFVRIFSHMNELKDPEHAFPWAKTAVIRTAINYYHRELKANKELVSLDPVGHDTVDATHIEIVGRLEIDSLVGIINELPAGYRMVLNLYLIDGYNHAEISEMLTITEGSSRSQLARGKAALIKKLELIGVRKNEFVPQK